MLRVGWQQAGLAAAARFAQMLARAWHQPPPPPLLLVSCLAAVRRSRPAQPSACAFGCGSCSPLLHDGVAEVAAVDTVHCLVALGQLRQLVGPVRRNLRSVQQCASCYTYVSRYSIGAAIAGRCKQTAATELPLRVVACTVHAHDRTHKSAGRSMRSPPAAARQWHRTWAGLRACSCTGRSDGHLHRSSAD